jgi:electron transport complex protein RnfG
MKSIIVLVSICLISAVALTFVNETTLAKRQENAMKVLENAKLKVLKNDIKSQVKKIIKIDKINEIQFYKVLNSSETIISYICEFSADGFGGKIKLLLGVELSGKITGLKVLEQKETPGLGAKIEEVEPTICQKYKNNSDEVDVNQPWFCEQYKGLSIEQLSLSKDGGKIDAITASTVSSRAVTVAVEKVLNVAKEKFLDN